MEFLREEVTPARTRVYPAVHGAEGLDVSLAELRALEDVDVHPLRIGAGSSFAHLKLYGFDDETDAWVFTTSANCTLAALGGDNVEAGLLRRIDRGLLNDYFAEDSNRALPTTQRSGEFGDSGRWLHLWAVERGPVVELAVGADAALPLGDVCVTIRVGGALETKEFGTLFDGARTAHVEWDPHSVPDRGKHTMLVTIEALDAEGGRVTGAAFVDNPLLLASDPTHRSAWRAAMTMLDGEGLPEASDLASIFHLVQDVFDSDDERASAQRSSGSREKSPAKLVIPDKVPIWPPLSDRQWAAATAGSGEQHYLRWFQNILTALLDGCEDQDAEGGEDPTDDVEVGTEPTRVRIPATIVRSTWKSAHAGYAKLRRTLDGLEVTKRTSRRIWPVAVAVFVATMLTRRRLSDTAGEDSELPPSDQLVPEFLRSLFADRPQPQGIGRSGHRYEYSTFPALAADLHGEFGEDPSPDLCTILLALFGHWQAIEMRRGRAVPTSVWLLYREVGPATLADSGIARDAVRIAFQRYFRVESEGIEWNEVEAALGRLAVTGWQSHDGYRQLDAIHRRATGTEVVVDFPEHLADRWVMVERRIQRGGDWVFPVEAQSDLCGDDACPRRYTIDPRKRRELRGLAPSICNACGAVLVPLVLWRAYRGGTGDE